MRIAPPAGVAAIRQATAHASAAAPDASVAASHSSKLPRRTPPAGKSLSSARKPLESTGCAGPLNVNPPPALAACAASMSRTCSPPGRPIETMFKTPDSRFLVQRAVEKAVEKVLHAPLHRRHPTKSTVAKTIRAYSIDYRRPGQLSGMFFCSFRELGGQGAAAGHPHPLPV